MIKVLAINISGIEMAALHRILGRLESYYNLIPAITTEKLIPIFDTLKPDLVILDFDKGVRLASEIRLADSSKNTPIFIIGNKDSNNKKTYQQLGITTFLDVPLHEKEIYEYIKHYFEIENQETVSTVKKKVA